MHRVAVIGCGYWGKNLVRNFAQLGRLSLVCDVTDSSRETALEMAGGAGTSPHSLDS